MFWLLIARIPVNTYHNCWVNKFAAALSTAAFAHMMLKNATGSFSAAEP